MYLQIYSKVRELLAVGISKYGTTDFEVCSMAS